MWQGLPKELPVLRDKWQKCLWQILVLVCQRDEMTNGVLPVRGVREHDDEKLVNINDEEKLCMESLRRRCSAESELHLRSRLERTTCTSKNSVVPYDCVSQASVFWRKGEVKLSNVWAPSDNKLVA